MSARSLLGVAVAGLLAVAGVNPMHAAPAAPVVIEQAFRAISVSPMPDDSAFEGCLLVLDVDPNARSRARAFTLCEKDGTPVLTPWREFDADTISATPFAVGGGAIEIHVGRESALDVWRIDRDLTTSTRIAQIEDERLGPFVTARNAVDLDGDATLDLIQAHYEGVSAWRRSEGGFVALKSARLPPSAAFTSRSIVVRTASLTEISPKDANVRYTAPSPEPGDRWRVDRVPFGAQGIGEPCAAWVELPAAMTPLRAAVSEGDIARLIALAQPADRLALLGELSLVIAPLECRRTGRGSAPTAMVKTKAPNYSGARLLLQDATGDGRDDIVLLAQAGRLDADPWIGVVPQQADGSFAKRTLDWKGKAESFSFALYQWEEDLDGDGRHDLTFLDDDALAVSRGLEPDGKRVPIEAKPSRRLVLPKGVTPQGRAVHRLEGDGRWLVVSATRAEAGQAKPVLIALPWGE